MSDIAILNAGQLITLDKGPIPRRGPAMRELSMVYNGAVIITDGLIEWVGTSDTAEQRIAKDFDVEIIDAEGRVVMPGFVDCQVQPLFPSPRESFFEARVRGGDFGELHGQGKGFGEATREFRKAETDDVRNNAGGVLEQMVAHGTTTVEVGGGFGLTSEHEAHSLQWLKDLAGQSPLNLVRTLYAGPSVPSEYHDRPDEHISQAIEKFLPQATLFADFCDITVDEGFFSPEDARRLLTAAHEFRLEPKLRGGLTSDLGIGALAKEVEALSAGHLNHLSPEGVKAFGELATVAVLQPAADLLTGLPAAPARELIDAGAAVALATGFNSVTSATWSMPLVWSLACMRYGMAPAEALTAMTVNAAAALNKQNTIGTLTKGKRGDVLIFNVDDYRQIPYYFGGNLIYSVIVGGKEAVTTEWADEEALKTLQRQEQSKAGNPGA